MRKTTKKKWEIYGLADPQSGEIRYIGVSHNPKKRYLSHLSTSKTRKTYKDNWIFSLLEKNLKPIYTLIEVGFGKTWKEREKYWISEYRKIGRLTNLTDGGEGVLGLYHSKDSREKMRSAHLGVKLSKEHCKNISKALSLRPITEEYRKKLSQSCSFKKPVICVETGIVYESITAASRKLNLNRVTLRDAIHKNHRCSNMHYRFVDKKEDV